MLLEISSSNLTLELNAADPVTVKKKSHQTFFLSHLAEPKKKKT
jgi:hypothetical protein